MRQGRRGKVVHQEILKRAGTGQARSALSRPPDLTRPGTNSELHLVDERIVGRKPASLDFGHAAALPLTAITAWEMLFDRLQVPRTPERRNEAILVIGAVAATAVEAALLASA